MARPYGEGAAECLWWVEWHWRTYGKSPTSADLSQHLRVSIPRAKQLVQWLIAHRFLHRLTHFQSPLMPGPRPVRRRNKT